MNENLMHMHDGQVFKLDKYQLKMKKKIKCIFLCKMWEKDYLVYAADKVNRMYEISTIHISNTEYRIRHTHKIVEE